MSINRSYVGSWFLIVAVLSVAAVAQDTDQQQFDALQVQGEYQGELTHPDHSLAIGAQVIALGDDRFQISRPRRFVISMSHRLTCYLK